MMKRGYETANCWAYDLMLQSSKEKRKNPTEAESILWNAVRASQCGVRFRRQHIIEDYIVDFVCLSKQLIIEVDGAYHLNEVKKDFDEQRSDKLKQLGFRVIRFKNEEIIANIDRVMDKIKEELAHIGSPLLGRGRGRLLIVSAPSGSGKSTIVQYLMKEHPEFRLAFSISATSRPPRGEEKHGVEYFFLTPEEFRQRIENNEFLEYEEVYPDRFYGTLKEQVETQLQAGQNVVFDVDVKGGCNIKKFYGERALSLFIQPPSIEELKRRLEGRNTDSADQIKIRLEKAAYEMSFAPQFDRILINDNLETAKQEAVRILEEFLASPSPSQGGENQEGRNK